HFCSPESTRAYQPLRGPGVPTRIYEGPLPVIGRPRPCPGIDALPFWKSSSVSSASRAVAPKETPAHLGWAGAGSLHLSSAGPWRRPRGRIGGRMSTRHDHYAEGTLAGAR